MGMNQTVSNQSCSWIESLPLLELGSFPIGINFRESTKEPLVIHHADPCKLGEEGVLRISGDLLRVYEEGFLLPKTEAPSLIVQRLDDLAAHIRGAHRVLIARHGANPVAFLCSEVLQLSVGKTYHLQGLVCHPSVQGTGLGQRLLEVDVSQSDAHYMFMHTQSIKMFRLFSRVADQSEEVAHLLAPQVTDKTLDGLVDRGRYHGRCLYGDVETFTKFALPGINGAEGDAMFVAGTIKR